MTWTASDRVTQALSQSATDSRHSVPLAVVPLATAAVDTVFERAESHAPGLMEAQTRARLAELGSMREPDRGRSASLHLLEATSVALPWAEGSQWAYDFVVATAQTLQAMDPSWVSAHAFLFRVVAEAERDYDQTTRPEPSVYVDADVRTGLLGQLKKQRMASDMSAQQVVRALNASFPGRWTPDRLSLAEAGADNPTRAELYVWCSVVGGTLVVPPAALTTPGIDANTPLSVMQEMVRDANGKPLRISLASPKAAGQRSSAVGNVPPAAGHESPTFAAYPAANRG